jgi:F-type H+-transporting ATPase subunit delta
MKRDKKITKLAKKLVEFSKDENGVVSEAKVSEVLAGLKQVQLRKPLDTLKYYLFYLRREIALQTAVVSTPTALSADTLQQIEAKYSAVYGRRIGAVTQLDPSLIAGVRVRVGDDVYDASIAGRLQCLSENVH